ncbi:MAG: LuxR C-terminal-related transcriptional regulator [Bacteroidetes bacterium]|nr:LuxR C-terminal-related transcriptional regulator [Bacteroidota bacterium]
MKNIVTTFEIEVALKRNNLELAKSLIPKATFEPFPIFHLFFIPQLTKVKLMLKAVDIYSPEETKLQLEQLIEFGKLSYHTTLLIQTYPLFALWHLKFGDKNEALTNLKISIDLARETGNVRNFLDLGEEMRILFNRLSPEEKDEPFVKQIIKTFNSTKQKSINSTIINQNNEIDLEAIDELSEKELEILRLVAIGFQNKEIADKVFLSPATIKTYLYRIYGKLGVKNRISAVTKTKQLYPTLLSQRITS